MDDYVGHLREFRRILRNLESQTSHPLNRETIDSLTRKLDRDESLINADRLESSIRATVEATRNLEELANYEQDVMSIFYEIVSRKRNELERERFRRVLDHAAESILVVEPHTGRFLDANERASATLGYTREELRELSLNHIEVGLPLTPSAAWQDWLESIPNAPEVAYVEGTHRRKDGTRLQVELSVAFAEVDHHRLLLIVARDATDRKRSDARLKRQWAFFSRLVHRSIDGILAFDRHFQLTYWNPAMERIFGEPRTAVIGKDLFEVLPQLRELGEDRYFKDALAGTTSTSRNRPFTVSETGRQVYFDGHYSPLAEENGEIVGGIGIIRDVTERRETQLRQAREAMARLDEQRLLQVEEKQRLEARIADLEREIEELRHDRSSVVRVDEGERSGGSEGVELVARGVAKAVEPLMAGILSQTGVALAELPSTSPLRRGVEEIEEAALSANELASTLSCFSGNGIAGGSPIQLNDLLSEVEHSLRSLVGPAVSLQFEARSRELPPVHGDWRQLRELVFILAKNAAEAMGDRGGVIRLSTGVVGLDDEALRSAHPRQGASPGEYVYLECSDEGEGIDEKAQQRIFIPFYSTRPGHRGLGLATALGILRAHQGLVTIESRPGRGATFRACFPLN